MFYNIISRIPKIVEATKKKKLLYISIIGTLIYIIIHAFLFSKQSESIGVITKYRYYIYVIMLLDFGIMYLMLKDDNVKSKEVVESVPSKVPQNKESVPVQETSEEVSSSDESSVSIKKPIKQKEQKKDEEVNDEEISNNEEENKDDETLSTIEVYDKESS